MTEPTVREHLERVVNDMALALAHDTDDQVRPLIPAMRASLNDLLSKHNISPDIATLTETLVSNIIQTRHEIRLGAGQMSRTPH
jgi:uncharacterized protein with von Willebrand factor type A (vWA) domain